MPTPIQNPAGYALSRAVGYVDIDGTMLQVSSAVPLPVTLGTVPTTALSGSTSVTGVVGPYQPALGRPVMLILNGTWSGIVKVTRSVDGGATRQPVTVAGNSWAQFTGNCCEPVWDESEAAARLYLDITLVSGTLAYRLAQ